MRKTVTRPTSPVTTTHTEKVRSLASNRIAAALDYPDPPVLDRLRLASAATRSVITQAQAAAVVAGVLAGTDRDTICTATGLDPDQVLDVVASLGTRMRHSRPGPDFDLVKAAETTRAKSFTAPGGGLTVVIPPGFERAGSGRRRDVTQALGSLVASNPTADEISDWVARQRPAASTVLEYTVLTTVHTFARFGRLDEIDEINRDAPELAGTLVDAVDLLLGGIRKGLSGFAAIVDGATGDDLEAAIVRARPLAEANVERVASEVESGHEALERARNAFTHWVAAGSNSVPAGIADLDSGQVLRIANAAGLIHIATNRTDETEIRARLGDMGLASAADLLVTAGIRALQAGIEDAFWESMELRALGDEEWDEPLRRASAAQAAKRSEH
jgi:hypothetical protein